MNTKLEECARSMAAAAYDEAHTSDLGRQEYIDTAWVSWLPQVRAALKVLREPSVEMMEIGERAISGAQKLRGSGVSHMGSAYVCWKDMIDAILHEAEEI